MKEGQTQTGVEETGKIFRNILSVRSILKLLLSSSAGGPVFICGSFCSGNCYVICKYLVNKLIETH